MTLIRGKKFCQKIDNIFNLLFKSLSSPTTKHFNSFVFTLPMTFLFITAGHLSLTLVYLKIVIFKSSLIFVLLTTYTSEVKRALFHHLCFAILQHSVVDLDWISGSGSGFGMRSQNQDTNSINSHSNENCVRFG